MTKMIEKTLSVSTNERYTAAEILTFIENKLKEY